MAFLLLHPHRRHHHLHQLAGIGYEQLLTFLFHLSYQGHQWYCPFYSANYSKNKMSAYDGFIVTIAPAANLLIMFLFYLLWKGHYFTSITEQEEDNSDVKPEKFCL